MLTTAPCASFCYYSFFFSFLFPLATLSDWPSFMRFPASEASDGSHSLLLLQLNNWIILMKGNLEGRKCFSFISFYLKCLKVCLKICSCQTGYMAKLVAGLAIRYKPDFFFQSFLFTILQIQSFHTPFVFCSVICLPLVFFYAPDNLLKCKSLQIVTNVKLKINPDCHSIYLNAI